MRIGVIGGSGLYDMEGMCDIENRELATPFGSPSDAYVCGTLEGGALCFLPRHGRGHRLLPSEINHRANIYGFKMLGVERIVSVSAVGSLREELRPGDIVLPDQYYDRTKASAGHTFFGNGIVAHMSFGDPACAELRSIVASAAKQCLAKHRSGDVRLVETGTYVGMEGPAFSTRAESNVYRELGFDIIGMTSLPEAKLCREAEICYQAMALVTDYDCWRQTEDPVSVEALIEVLQANTKLARQIIRTLVTAAPEQRTCSCPTALRNAIMTDLATIPLDTKRRLNAIIGKYVS